MVQRIAERWADLRDRVPPSVRAIAPDVWRGVRGAIATLVPFLLAGLWHREELAWTALGGWLGTLADPGGTRGARARVLASFAILGAIFVALSTSASREPLAAALALGAAAFAASLLRALGATGASLGTMLAIVFAIGIGRVHADPLRDALYFALGAGWAVLLSSIVWPVGTHAPVRRSCARALRELAAYADELAEVALAGTERHDPRWSDVARARRRRVRDAVEEARAMSLAIRARAGGASALGTGLRVLVGLIDAQLALVVALGEEVEASDRRVPAIASLERLASVDLALAQAVVSRIAPRVPALVPREDEVTASVAIARVEASLRDMAALVATIDHPRDDPAPVIELQGAPRIGEALRALRDALSPRSLHFAHALRVAGAAIVAAGIGRVVSPTYAHWVTVTTIAVLQPYPGATYRRAIERVIGTVLGTLLAVAVALAIDDPRGLAAVMFPLSVAALATRPRSYRLFTLFLTPVFVLLAEQSPDAPDDLVVVASRVGDAALGGLIAVVASLGVLPSWERERLPAALGKMLDEVAAHVRAVMEWWRDPAAPGARDAVTRCRRTAGVALGNAEVSLERMLSEPRGAESAADALDLVTYARRLAGAMTALASTAPGPAPHALREIEAHLVTTLTESAAAVRSGTKLRPPVDPPALEPIIEGSERARLESALRYAGLIARRLAA